MYIIKSTVPSDQSRLYDRIDKIQKMRISQKINLRFLIRKRAVLNGLTTSSCRFSNVRNIANYFHYSSCL